ncbi:MAG: hypothetical protein R3F24_04070 [Gammaproteobacteria bacterium]
MNPLRLIRTSTFQLAWWYMGIFGASALVLIRVVWWVTVGYLEEQTNSILNEEIQGLVTEYGQRGCPDWRASSSNAWPATSVRQPTICSSTGTARAWLATCSPGLRSHQIVADGTTWPAATDRAERPEFADAPSHCGLTGTCWLPRTRNRLDATRT